MNATILPNSEKHYPVLLKEILSIISPQNGGTFIDCTFGQGGYSKALLRYNNTNVIAALNDMSAALATLATAVQKLNDKYVIN